MTYRVAMDIGGTFTDFVVIDEGRLADVDGQDVDDAGRARSKGCSRASCRSCPSSPRSRSSCTGRRSG